MKKILNSFKGVMGTEKPSFDIFEMVVVEEIPPHNVKRFEYPENHYKYTILVYVCIYTIKTSCNFQSSKLC